MRRLFAATGLISFLALLLAVAPPVSTAQDQEVPGSGNTKWSCVDGLCCTNGYHSFWVSFDSKKLTSTNKRCGGKYGSWPGYAVGPAGSKGGTWGVKAACTKYGGSIRATLSADKCYFFLLTVSGSTRVIRLYRVLNCGKPYYASGTNLPVDAELAWEHVITEADRITGGAEPREGMDLPDTR